MKKVTKLINKANYWATPIYEQLPSWFFPKRHLKFKAYGVGMAKTGTVTLHIMFSKHYRSAHEPESRFLANKIVAFAHNKINKNDFIKYIKQRELTQSIPRIERFLGMMPGTLPTSARGNVTTQKFNILSQIDKDFLEAKANFHCKELMDKYFPEIKGFNS